jgi:hypothetical protein
MKLWPAVTAALVILSGFATAKVCLWIWRAWA